MNYQDQQHQLIRDLEQQFKNGLAPSTIVEPVNDYVNDNRICLTSLTFIPENVYSKIKREIIDPLQAFDPRQYFYGLGSMHVTIQNIRTISDPPLFTKEDVIKVREVFGTVLRKYSKFPIVFKGLFQLPTSFALCGFTDSTFGDMVLEIRRELEKAGVPDNKKYADGPVLASSTLCRYTTQPNEEFMQQLQKLKDIEIGELIVSKIALLTTNAVDHPSKTTIIEEFVLQ